MKVMRQAGFSMVEVLVALAIALLATLVIFNVNAVFEGTKRTTVATAGTQENGLFAMYSLERDIRIAGRGFLTPVRPALGLPTPNCSVIHSYFENAGGAVSPAPGLPTGAIPLMAVRITEGAGPNGSDIVTALYGASARAGIATRLAQPMGSPGDDLVVDSVAGIAQGDLILVQRKLAGLPPAPCTVMQVTNAAPFAGNVLQHANSPLPTFNPNHGTAPYSGWPVFERGDPVFVIGRLTTATYAVAASGANFALTVDNGGMAPPVELVSDIMTIEAQYGIAPVGSQSVNCWVNATTGNACDGTDWANPTQADIDRIKAIRIAIVTRAYDSNERNTGNACSTTTNNSLVAWSDSTGVTQIDISAWPDWRCFRYNVFQTVIPLRNVLWANR